MANTNNIPSHTEYGEFDGQPAKINYSDNDRRQDIYYGGDRGDGNQDNHSHVTVVNDTVRYWREGPKNGGDVLIDESDKDNPIKY